MGWDDRTQKEKEIDRRASHSLEAIRRRQQEKASADYEKTQLTLKLARDKAAEARERDQANQRRKERLQSLAIQSKAEERETLLQYRSEEGEITRQHRSEENEITRQFRTQELEERRELSQALTIAKAEAGLELEQLRHELREAERAPNFEDYQMRAELDFLIRRQERLDQNQIENLELERRITELRAMSRADIHKAVLMAVIEHIRSENEHARTLAELQADADAEMMKAEQAHGHRIEQDNNASRLRVSEMYSARLLDVVFSQIGAQSSGLSRTDVDAMVSEWEKQGDRLKR